MAQEQNGTVDLSGLDDLAYYARIFGNIQSAAAEVPSNVAQGVKKLSEDFKEDPTGPVNFLNKTVVLILGGLVVVGIAMAYFNRNR